MLPLLLQIALKEWAAVCQAIEAGRQIVLLRKGGISDAGSRFEVQHPQFLFFPTYLHQNRQMLKPQAHAGLQDLTQEPSRLTLRLAAEVTDIVQLQSRGQMQAIDQEHIWTSPLIDMRFDYRPQNPLYLLLVRAYRLSQPVTIDNTPAYAGCKSWVPLDEPVNVSGSQPALSDADFGVRRQRLLESLAAVG